MRESFEAATVLTGRESIANGVVTLDDGVIAGVTGSVFRESPITGGGLLPGFIDWQVNGGGGILFNDEPTPEALEAIARAHRLFGTTRIVPTLITDTDETMSRAAAAVQSALERRVPGVLGIHWEGPFLSPSRKGAHRAELMRRLTLAEADALPVMRGGVTVATVAPECCDPGAIARLVARGVVVSAGHSEATGATMRAAAAEGLRGVTHLFNAMSQLGPREPGLAGSALANAALTAGLIADGVHVSAEALRIAFRSRGAEGLTLITDAMPPLGAPAMKRFDLFGRSVTVREGMLTLEDGTLAGAATGMLACLKTMAASVGATFADIIPMATTTPARFLGLAGRVGELGPGARADMLLLTPEGALESIWMDGVRDRM